jgi:hypothetical protein
VLVHPSAMIVFTQTLTFVATTLRRHRKQLGTRWRLLSSGRQALMLLAHLHKGETYRDLAAGFGIAVTTAYRYLREALQVLAALASTLEEAMAVAARKAYATLDGTLVRINRVATASGNDRPYYSGKTKCHGVNVQVIADPVGRLIWASPALPGARHDASAAAAHALPTALADAGVTALADTAYCGFGLAIRAPHLHTRYWQVRLPRVVGRAEGGQPRPLGPVRSGRANAVLKSWRILRKIRSIPARHDQLR